MPDRKLKVFLCHAKEDKSTVRELYRQLTAEGWIDPWLDEENLFPGQDWDTEIEKAVEQSDVVLVCLSSLSVEKVGYIQRELRFILNVAEEKPEGMIFIVPLRLDDCAVPRRIRDLQYADYFPKAERPRAYDRLLTSLKLRAGKLGIATGKPAPMDESANIERERQAAAERQRIAAQQVENERLARQKAEAVQKAKAERDRLARQQAEARKKAFADALQRINFKRIFAVGGVVVAMLVLFYIGKTVINNLPAAPEATATLTDVSLTNSLIFTPTFTEVPFTETPFITPTPVFGVGSTWTSSPETGSVTMLYVPAGEFTMGDTNADAMTQCRKYRSDCQSSWFTDEQPPHQVYLASYWMDQTEVTNAMYKKCVDAGICTPPRSNSSNTYQSYYGNSQYDDYPVIYVDWNQAKTYCEWRGEGTRLPTEAEWEKAASWDADTQTKRVYPWGDSIDCSYANYWSNNNGACKGDTTKVGSYPSGASFYGMLDMAGNVWEWVADWYDAYPGNTVNNSDYGTKYRVLRGGSWNVVGDSVRSADRGGSGPSDTLNSLGFRCSRSP